MSEYVSEDDDSDLVSIKFYYHVYAYNLSPFDSKIENGLPVPEHQNKQQACMSLSANHN